MSSCAITHEQEPARLQSGKCTTESASYEERRIVLNFLNSLCCSFTMRPQRGCSSPLSPIPTGSSRPCSPSWCTVRDILAVCQGHMVKCHEKAYDGNRRMVRADITRFASMLSYPGSLSYAMQGAMPQPMDKLAAGEAGCFADLAARGVIGDQLTPHHMPQTAARFTSRDEGGALVLPHGVRGRVVAHAEARLPFRQVLARDIRDIRRITGRKYNKGLRDLITYYREHFSALMHKQPQPGNA